MLARSSWVLLSCLLALTIAQTSDSLNNGIQIGDASPTPNPTSNMPAVNSSSPTMLLTPLVLGVPTPLESSIPATVQNATQTIGDSMPVTLSGPTPVSGNGAYGQITVDNSGVSMTQMYSPNCASYTNGVCNNCSFRFVQGDQGCEPVNPLCATWDSTGACMTCYIGYEICENGCIMLESCAPGGTFDPNCANTVNGICQKCSLNYYFNSDGVCTQVSPFCKNSDSNGNCLSCYAGYSLNGGQCTVSPNPAIGNPYCANWINGVCQQCATSSYNSSGQCVAYNPMCATINTSNGQCLTCYSGYSLSNGNCVLNTNTGPSDLLCKKWDNNGVCSQCATRAYFGSNMCVAVDSLCNTFSSQNGNCLTCYNGYNLQNGRCVVVPPSNNYNNNQYCAVWNGNTCQQCAVNTYFNSENVCVPTNPTCASVDSNQNCLTCYTGYTLQNSSCIIVNINISVSNALCAKWVGTQCVQCATRSYNASGVCTAVNTLCDTWSNIDGSCLSCYNAYLLQGSICVLNNNAVTDNPLCNTFNGSTCTQCANRAYFSNGICVAVNDFCNSFSSQTGQCTSCYNGFALSNGVCNPLPTPTQPSGPSATFDIYCSRTGSNGICIRCFYGFALKNGVCVADFKNTACGKNPQFCSP